jgi:Concanavalin A-like lectin/glucanases superfamily
VSYESVCLADSPAFLWPLNETSGTTAADATGNGHTGTYTGGYTLNSAAGPISGGGNAVLLNGSSGYIASSYNPSLSAVSLECWVNFNGLSQGGNNSRFIANDHVNNDNNGFDCNQENDEGGVIVVSFGNGTSHQQIATSTVPPSTGWFYFVTTWDGTTINIYENASNIGSHAFSGSLTSGSANVAAGYNPAYSGDYLHGLMAWVAVYPSALTSTQVTNHYNAAAGGTPHTATAALTVTPAFSLVKAEAHVQSATITPAFTVKKAEAHKQAATITPVFTALGVKNFGKGGTPDRHHRKRSW